MKRTIPILAVAVLALTAGCLGSLTGGGGDGAQAQGPPPLDDVPNDAEFILSYDQAFVQDAPTRAVMNTLLEESAREGSDDPTTVEEALEQARNESLAQSNLSIDELGGVMVFGAAPQTAVGTGGSGTPYFGLLVRTGWAEEDVVAALQNEYEITETTYQGVTVYNVSGTVDAPGGVTTQDSFSAAAKYDENLWVFGSQESVRNVIDVNEGNADALSGELRSVYESTDSDGYFRFAAAFPEQYRQAMGGGGGGVGGMGSLSLQNVTHFSGAYYTEGGQDGSVGINVNMHVSDSSSADTLRQQLDGVLGFAPSMTQNQTLKDQINKLSVEADGSVVTLNYESSVADLQALARQYVSPTNGFSGSGGDSGSMQAVPQVSIDYSYEADSGRVVAIHNGGDTISGENLRAICAGSTVETASGEITAGQTIVETTACSAGDELRLVWTDGQTSSVIGTFQIPSGSLVAPVAP